MNPKECFFQQFKNGEFVVFVEDFEEFKKLMSSCEEYGIRFLNGKYYSEEVVHEESVNGRTYMVNEDSTKRYTFRCINYYVVINGSLRKKSWRWVRGSSLPRKNHRETAIFEWIDENGFEKEIY